MRISDWSSDVCSSDLWLLAVPGMREFINIWVEAIAEAQRKTRRAGITSACFVLVSTTRTPVTFLVFGSYSRLETTASERSVSRAVARAAGRVAAGGEK